ncbi:hypothetical protein niasHS_012818 [Heterodera schachtii]|uniref:Tc1-like transposase DDE domain-containing protein n=1 Tax=Heterodera schachtii TaxID=97005 RepID=A0ABD2IE79_HETSC
MLAIYLCDDDWRKLYENKEIVRRLEDDDNVTLSFQMSAEAEIGTLKEMLKLQNEKMKDVRHCFVNFRSRLDQLEAWASDNKKSNLCVPTHANACCWTIHQKYRQHQMLLLPKSWWEAKVCAEFAIAAAERKMREQIDAQMQVERERNRKNLKAAMEEQNARCRRLALQSFRAAKEMVEKKMGCSILDNDSGVTPIWEQHCMFCLGGEAMFGRKECAHVNVCADCSINMDTYGTAKSTGRPPKLTPRAKRRILAEISNSTEGIRRLQRRLAPEVSRETVRRAIKFSPNIVRQRVQRQPHLKDNHKLARMAFAELHVPNPLQKEPRIFSKRPMGGGSVMCWAAFSQFGTTPIVFVRGRMDSEAYQALLENFLLPYLDRWPRIDFTFQQDNAPCHSSNSTKQWFRDHNVDVLAWPACSPDLNPIENVWGMLARAVYADCRQFQTFGDLKKAIQEAWAQITQEKLTRLVESMPRRLISVLKNNGGITKY